MSQNYPRTHKYIKYVKVENLEKGRELTFAITFNNMSKCQNIKFKLVC